MSIRRNWFIARSCHHGYILNRSQFLITHQGSIASACHRIHRSFTSFDSCHSNNLKRELGSKPFKDQQLPARNSRSQENDHHQQQQQKKAFSYITRQKIVNFLLWIPVVVLINEHGFSFVRITGRSMQPTFNPDSSCLKRDIVLVQKFLDKSTSLKRGDVVIFEHPENPKILLTKRILGLAGDVIKVENPHKKSGRLVRIPMGHCWVEGDERFHSEDSNSFGSIPLGLINSKVLFIVWPISRFGSSVQIADQSKSRNLFAQA